MDEKGEKLVSQVHAKLTKQRSATYVPETPVTSNLKMQVTGSMILGYVTVYKSAILDSSHEAATNKPCDGSHPT